MCYKVKAAKVGALMCTLQLWASIAIASLPLISKAMPQHTNPVYRTLYTDKC